jgi:hypothetical protein
LVWQEFRYSRKAKYAEAFSYLRQIFYETSTKDGQHIGECSEIENICRLIVNRLATAFSLITGTKCSVCIKVLVLSDDSEASPRPKVATLCRDDTSLDRERGSSPLEHWVEELENPQAIEHWVQENTDFQQIFERVGTPQRVFFSNYLPGLRGYQNTSFQVYGQPTAHFRGVRWPLPYRSTVVAPISRVHQLQRSPTLAGYLCVDSRSRSVFNRRYDIDLITGVGDCLFDLVHRYCELASESFESEEGGHGDG